MYVVYTLQRDRQVDIARQSSFVGWKKIQLGED